jgi:uncharacterized Zn finger protein
MAPRRRTRTRFSRYDDYDGYGGWGGFAPYVSVAARKAQAARQVLRLKKSGHTVAPVAIAGRKIATTFWGTSWCDNLERYSDYANRIPRGRTYVRNGSVIDLQIEAGRVAALVSGSSIYHVSVNVAPVPARQWRDIRARCAGGIDSLVELLQGRFSKGVMAHLCQQGTGLFPTPSEIEFDCSCPDGAYMCKHIAAVLYGVGARLDHQPELLFRLRKVSEEELVATAAADVPLSRKAPAAGKILEDRELADVFGVEFAPPTPALPVPSPLTPAPSRSKSARAGRRKQEKGKKAAPAGKAKAMKPTTAAKPTKAPKKPKLSAARRKATSPSRARARRRLSPTAAR